MFQYNSFYRICSTSIMIAQTWIVIKHDLVKRTLLKVVLCVCFVIARAEILLWKLERVETVQWHGLTRLHYVLDFVRLNWNRMCAMIKILNAFCVIIFCHLPFVRAWFRPLLRVTLQQYFCFSSSTDAGAPQKIFTLDQFFDFTIQSSKRENHNSCWNSFWCHALSIYSWFGIFR